MLSKMEQNYILEQYKKYGIQVASWGGTTETPELEEETVLEVDMSELVDEFWDRL